MIKSLLASAAFMTLASATAFAADADPCAVSRTATVTFTGKAATDIVTARAFSGPVQPGAGSIAENAGQAPNCILATVALTIHKADGSFLGGYIAPLARANYDAGHMMEPQSPEAIGKFLDEWVKVTLSTTAEAPERDSGATFTTTFDDETYKAIRAAKYPMLCYAEDSLSLTCLFADADGYAQPYYTLTTD
ncbi:hypothetical protein sos41_16470 [Alphaproteobacteria bacterium SO-S41]|nr:hypothetical protein sos41_16470 [Alphaproteobacteria bacterium SO-S41]